MPTCLTEKKKFAEKETFIACNEYSAFFADGSSDNDTTWTLRLDQVSAFLTG